MVHTDVPVHALAREFEYYLAHQSELVAKYDGRVLAIKGQKILGDFDSEPEAIAETAKTQEMGTFLVQRCTSGTAGYTGVYHSRFSA